MKTGVPPKPVGNSPKWFFMRKVWDYLFGGMFPIKGEDPVQVSYEGQHYFIRVKPQGGTSASTSLQCFRLMSVDADYVIAKTWDGTTMGTDNVYIAKNKETRSPVSEKISGNTWAYTYSVPVGDVHNGTRVATATVDGNAITETQVVVPYWQAFDVLNTDSDDCLIWAMKADYTGVIKDEGEDTEEELTWLLVTSRCWAKMA